VVSYVIDGDTIVLNNGEHVRLIGVDTPELKSNDCFAVESKDALTRLILHKSVTLVDDKNNRDVYGRHLAYVMFGSVDVSLWLASNGFARYMYVSPNGARIDKYKKAVYAAIDAKKGRWAKCKR